MNPVEEAVAGDVRKHAHSSDDDSTARRQSDTHWLYCGQFRL